MNWGFRGGVIEVMAAFTAVNASAAASLMRPVPPYLLHDESIYWKAAWTGEKLDSEKHKPKKMSKNSMTIPDQEI